MQSTITVAISAKGNNVKSRFFNGILKFYNKKKEGQQQQQQKKTKQNIQLHKYFNGLFIYFCLKQNFLFPQHTHVFPVSCVYPSCNESITKGREHSRKPMRGESDAVSNTKLQRHCGSEQSSTRRGTEGEGFYK